MVWSKDQFMIVQWSGAWARSVRRYTGWGSAHTKGLVHSIPRRMGALMNAVLAGRWATQEERHPNRHPARNPATHNRGTSLTVAVVSGRWLLMKKASRAVSYNDPLTVPLPNPNGYPRLWGDGSFPTGYWSRQVSRTGGACRSTLATLPYSKYRWSDKMKKIIRVRIKCVCFVCTLIAVTLRAARGPGCN